MKPIRVMILALVLISCGAPPAISGNCPDVAGVESVLKADRVLLLGEIHGTQEGPAFVETVACHALAAGLPVTVALELPTSEEPRVAAFVASSGGEVERDAVRSLPFWAKDYQDGRTSTAMLDLLGELRGWREAGRDVQVILIDQPRHRAGRDAGMAERILKSVKESPARMVIALTGNIHNMVSGGRGRMGEHLVAALEPGRVLSLNQTYTGGSAWICEATAGCGPLGLGGRGQGDDQRIEVAAEGAGGGYHGTFHVGAITASPPARRVTSALEGDP